MDPRLREDDALWERGVSSDSAVLLKDTVIPVIYIVIPAKAGIQAASVPKSTTRLQNA